MEVGVPRSTLEGWNATSGGEGGGEGVGEGGGGGGGGGEGTSTTATRMVIHTSSCPLLVR